MSVLVRYYPTGLTKEQYNETSRRIEGSEAWPPEGLDVHVCFGSDGDLRVSEIWDSEEQWRAFSEKLLPVLQESGVQTEREPELLEIHELQKR